MKHKFLLSEICDVIGGFTPRNKADFVDANEGIPFYTRRNFLDNSKDVRFIEKKVFKNKNKTLREGILLSCVGSLEVFWKKENVHYNEDNYLLKSKDNKKVSEKYLYYYFLHNKDTLYEKISKKGTLFSRTSKKKVSEINVELPNFDTQKKIGDFLWKVDKKIKKMENLLNEDIDLSLLDFRIINKVLDQSNLLKAYKLIDICDIIEGFMPKNKEEFGVVDGGIPFFTRRNFLGDSKNIRFIKKKVFKNRNKTLQEGILLSCVGSLRVFWKKKDIHYTRQHFLLKSKNNKKTYEKYLYYYFLHNKDNLYKEFSQQGTVFSNMPKEKVGKILVKLPCFEEQKKIADFIWENDKRMTKLRKLIKEYIHVLKNLTKIIIEISMMGIN